MKSVQFNKWYRNAFEQMKEEPPQEAWDNISNELDLQEVWGNVKNELQVIETRKQTAKLLSYTISFAFLVLLSIVGSVWLFTPENLRTDKSKKNPPAEISNTFVQAGKTIQKDEINNQLPVIDPKKLAPHSIRQLVISNRPSTTIPTLILNPQINNQQPTLFTVPPIETSDMLTSQNNEHPIILSDASLSSQLPEITSPHEFFVDKFYLGGTYKITNSWLLNDETYNGLAKTGLIQTLSHLGKSGGITLEYCFSKEWSGQIDWFINSQSGQTYKYYEEGKYIKKDIVINYQLINLLIKHSLGGTLISKNISTSQNLLTGINFKSLESEKVKINDVEVTQPQHYTNDDYGFIVGYEYTFLFNKKILLSSAITGDFGLKNIFKGSEKIPANFNSTYNTSINAVFGIKYLLQ